MIKKEKKPFILIILDGWGLAPNSRGNAISLAKTPVIDKLMKDYPYTELFAHGKYAGLPINQVGNSESGHMNIGAGRLVEQDSVNVSKSIKNKTFFKNSAFQGAIRHIRKMNSKMHVMGMLSNGQSPHSDPEHLLAILNLLKKNKVNDVILHLFTDGRDSPKYSSLKLIGELQKNLFNNERIATIIGRFYAMDRKKKWERTARSYSALTREDGGKIANTPEQAITEMYNKGESDEFIEPFIITNGENRNTRIEEGDSVIFFNLRSDRSRQLAKVFVQHDFNKMNPDAFTRNKKLDHVYFVAMTDFGPDLDEILTAFPSIDAVSTLPVVMQDYSQVYIAETEKYAHVTYFFNGGYSGLVANEVQYMVPSPDVRSYDATPLMSSKELTNKVLSNLKKNKFDFTVLNFAAPDMVGHTGNLRAGIECCSGIDKLTGKIVDEYLKKEGTVLITADHGNIEKMINEKTGEIFTEHTKNQVPFILVGEKHKKIKLRKNGILGDISPTILELINIKKPKEMSGKSLIV